MDVARRASFLLPLSLLGCRNSARSPEQAGNEFIDRYYVERNHARALELAAEGAAERVKNEQRMLNESGSAPYGVQPRVFYKLVKQEPKESSLQLTYLLTIDSGGVTMKKDLVLVLREIDHQFKVTFFLERDPPGT